jgi:sugar O-acyltransferase (sialic acid O-acetyltransferase NeuD family)
VNRPIYVYGAGGHGKVVADILLSCGHLVAGFVDDGKEPGTCVIGIPVAGNGDWLFTTARSTAVAVALGIGDNHLRHQIADACARHGIELVTAVHRGATVSPFVEIGIGAVVMAGAVINPGARIGRGAVVNTGAVVDHDAVLGDFAQIMPNAAMAGATRLGTEAQLGTGACVIPRVSIGVRSIVGAGAVVIRDLPDNVVAVGVPAVIKRSLPVTG